MITTLTNARLFHGFLLAATFMICFPHTAPATAEEQTLRFKLVTQQVGVPTVLPEIGGGRPWCSSAAATWVRLRQTAQLAMITCHGRRSASLKA
jgi:hypothetical protein